MPLPRPLLTLVSVDDPQPSPPSDLPRVLQLAAELSDEGRWHEAYNLLAEQESEHPSDPLLLCMLGVAAREVEARPLAYDYFRRSLAEQPSDPLVLVTAGVGLSYYDDPEAETALRLAALSAPTLFAARLAYGSYLAREGMLDLALAELTAAREIDPGDARVHREIGVAHLLRTGGEEPGARALEEALSLSDEDAELRLLYALSLVRLGELETAAEEMHRASPDLLEDGEAQLVTALACAAQEWIDEAWEALARAEHAPFPPDSTLLQEAEEALESGAPAASHLLREQLAPSMLRERLFERSA